MTYTHPRRNQPGDREKAMKEILPIVESGNKVASDVYCLCGRIYKDMFMSSAFTDESSRDQACYWYAKFGHKKFSTFEKSGIYVMFSRLFLLYNLPGMGKPLRQSQLFTRASTMWSSW